METNRNKVYQFKSLRMDGSTTCGTIIHNKRRFRSWVGQCWHEAAVIAKRDGTSIRSMIATEVA